MTNKEIKRIGIGLACLTALLIILGLSACYLVRKITLHQVGLVSENFLTVEDEPVKAVDYVNPYSFFLNDEMAYYIMGLCQDFSVDSDFAIALLMKENPKLDFNSIGKPNNDGTIDVGLWQLNDRYLYSKDGFIEMFWPKDFPKFDAMNWKHNTYVAIKLIKDLQKTFGENAYEKIAAAYNCGTRRVFEESIPYTTRTDYVPSVMNNLAVIRMSAEVG